MKHASLFAAALLLVAVGLVSFAWGSFAQTLVTPAAEDIGSREEIVVVPPGADAIAVIDLLRARDLVPPSDWFPLYVEWFWKERPIIPGEYVLSSATRPMAQLEIVTSGRVVMHEFVVRVGDRIDDVIDRLVDARLASRNDLAELAFDETFARSAGIHASSLEGYIVPDGYSLPRGLDATTVLEMLVARRRDLIPSDVRDDADARGLDLHALLTMASLIQTSGFIADEWRQYSAVLHNRLARDIPLEHSATLAYGIARNAGASAREPDSRPWNTDLWPGLPPTPICSPSADAIVAAAHPAEGSAIFIAARPDGTHIFCADSDCHRDAIARYKDAAPKETSERTTP